MTISENYQRVLENLKSIGADLQKIRVMGVTKKQSIEKIREGIAVGIHLLGNNYAQEGEPLMQQISESVEWHFIGHIQSRKVKYLTTYDCVQSLDRLEVARLLNDRLALENRKQKVLIEVNVGGEGQKSGIAPDQLEQFLNAVKGFSQLEIRGLMCLPPPLEPVESRAPFFDQMAQLYHRFGQRYSFDTLSMGTSEDYQIAVRHGATLIRLGTTLFGARPGF